MTITDILLTVDHTPQCAKRTTVASDFASQIGAHLTALYVIPKIDIPNYAGVNIPPEVLATQEKYQMDIAQQAKTDFAAATKGKDCSTEWRCVSGIVDQQIIEHARYSDLVVISQAQEFGLLSGDAAVDYSVILESGRPVLIIPRDGEVSSLGRRILIGWNGSKEVVRAVNDGLPLLKNADTVTIGNVGDGSPDDDEEGEARIYRYLKKQGVNVQFEQLAAAGAKTGAALLAKAADVDADMMLMGAYGHSRLREVVFGGVTQTILEQTTIPVLMSH